jgi:hypothetical protein
MCPLVVRGVPALDSGWSKTAYSVSVAISSRRATAALRDRTKTIITDFHKVQGSCLIGLGASPSAGLRSGYDCTARHLRYAYCEPKNVIEVGSDSPWLLCSTPLIMSV